MILHIENTMQKGEICMRRTKRSGSFMLCLLINMLLNPEGLIPAALLIVMHFLMGWSVWWAVLAIGLWILGLILWMSIIGWASKCGSTQSPHKENKNPYSSGISFKKQ